MGTRIDDVTDRKTTAVNTVITREQE